MKYTLFSSISLSLSLYHECTYPTLSLSLSFPTQLAKAVSPGKLQGRRHHAHHRPAPREWFAVLWWPWPRKTKRRPISGEEGWWFGVVWFCGLVLVFFLFVVWLGVVWWFGGYSL